MICKGMKEGKPPALTAQVAFVLPKEAKSAILLPADRLVKRLDLRKFQMSL